jgi:hypothetical protein
VIVEDVEPADRVPPDPFTDRPDVLDVEAQIESVGQEMPVTDKA